MAAQALDAMGSCTCAAIGGLALGEVGKQVGSRFGPIGSFIGSTVGYMAGRRVGELVWEGGKAIARTVAAVATEVREVGRSAVRSLNPLKSPS